MTGLHIGVGVALVAVNLLAGAWGAWAWHRAEPSRVFWPLLRAGQGLVMIEAALGGVLLAEGEELPPLHLIYGLAPLGVALFAELLRVAAAQTVLDQRGLASSADVAQLPEHERRALVLAIIRREIGVMTASALVVAVLGLRAGEWL